MDTIELVPYVRGEPLWRAVRFDPNLSNKEIHISKYGIFNIGPSNPMSEELRQQSKL